RVLFRSLPIFDGTVKNWKEAAKWYQQAAEHGNSDAQVNLGVLYMDGRGVNADLAQAYKWLKLAYNQGNNKSKPLLSEIANSHAFTSNQLARARVMINDYEAR